MRWGRDARGIREAVWALLLAALLSAGVLTVLLLNTSTQQQSVTLTHQEQQVQALQAQVQGLTTALEHNTDPRRLAARARRLRMRPAKNVRWRTTVSAPLRAVLQAPAG